MSSKMMWMGPRGYEQWVPPCLINPDFSSVGWQAKTQLLNGGANVRTSFASHKEYAMSWPPRSRDTYRPLLDMASGMFGDGLIYFIDPMAMDKNVLPEHWAFPAQAALDGPVLLGDTRPNTIQTPTNSNGYPALSVQYPTTGTSASLYIPIPPGYVAWVGQHGSSDGVGGVRVTPIQPGDVAITPVFPSMLPVTSTTRVDTSFSGDTLQGISLDLAVSTATAVFISGVIVQILANGVTPAPGGFISGQGNSGCRFEQKPTQTPYSTGTPESELAISAKLAEVGGWL